MNINLSKALVFLDLETTGLSVGSDRIVRILLDVTHSLKL